MAEITFEINTEWFKEDPNFGRCDACGDMMVINSNGLYIFVGTNLLYKDASITICNSCYNATNDNNGI